MRAIHRLRYFAEDAWDEWIHSPGVNLLAAATLTAALFLAGLVVLLLVNVRQEVDRQRESVPVEVYLSDDLSEAAREQMRDELAAEPGVARVDFVDKAQALQRYREWAEELAGLVEELEANPLPAAFEVILEPSPAAAEVADRIIARLSGAVGVDEVRFDREWLKRLDNLVDAARKGGVGLAVVVFAAVILVMSSVLRLAVFARQEEIEIMLLVGATPNFVRGPFLVTGFVQGLAASGLALLLVEGARRLILAHDQSVTLLVDLVASQPLPLVNALAVVLAGLTVSLTGSYFAVRIRPPG